MLAAVASAKRSNEPLSFDNLGRPDALDVDRSAFDGWSNSAPEPLRRRAPHLQPLERPSTGERHERAARTLQRVWRGALTRAWVFQVCVRDLRSFVGGLQRDADAFARALATVCLLGLSVAAVAVACAPLLATERALTARLPAIGADEEPLAWVEAAADAWYSEPAEQEPHACHGCLANATCAGACSRCSNGTATVCAGCDGCALCVQPACEALWGGPLYLLGVNATGKWAGCVGQEAATLTQARLAAGGRAEPVAGGGALDAAHRAVLARVRLQVHGEEACAAPPANVDPGACADGSLHQQSWSDDAYDYDADAPGFVHSVDLGAFGTGRELQRCRLQELQERHWAPAERRASVEWSVLVWNARRRLWALVRVEWRFPADGGRARSRSVTAFGGGSGTRGGAALALSVALLLAVLASLFPRHDAAPLPPGGRVYAAQASVDDQEDPGAGGRPRRARRRRRRRSVVRVLLLLALAVEAVLLLALVLGGSALDARVPGSVSLGAGAQWWSSAAFADASLLAGVSAAVRVLFAITTVLGVTQLVDCLRLHPQVAVLTAWLAAALRRSGATCLLFATAWAAFALLAWALAGLSLGDALAWTLRLGPEPPADFAVLAWLCRLALLVLVVRLALDLGFSWRGFRGRSLFADAGLVLRMSGRGALPAFELDMPGVVMVTAQTCVDQLAATGLASGDIVRVTTELLRQRHHRRKKPGVPPSTLRPRLPRRRRFSSQFSGLSALSGSSSPLTPL